MTWVNALIMVITLANLVLLLMLTRHVVRINRFRDMVLEEKKASEATARETFAEPAPEPLPAPPPAPYRPNRIEQPAPKTAQIKIALERLRAGENAEDVARDLGYSRSEMGILVASARRS